MRFTRIVLILIGLFSASLLAQERSTPTPECIQQSVAQHLQMLDTLRAAVFDIYPRELLDSAAFESALATAREKTRAEVDCTASYFRYILQGLLNNYCPTESDIVSYERTCHDADLEIYVEVLPPKVHASREDKGFGVVGVDIPLPYNMTEPLEAALDTVRETRGVLLDFSRNCCGFAWVDVTGIFSRLIDVPMDLMTVRVRIPGTTRTRDSVIVIKPRGEWQYTKPIVALMDVDCSWTGALLSYGLSRRLYTTVVGFPQKAPRGILPVNVSLPGGTIIKIPTAVWVDRNGNRQKEVKPDVTAAATGAKGHDAVYRQGMRLLKDRVMAREKEERRRIEWLFDK
jgi:hypothetical protein